jgi:hypothetical protein
VFSSDLFSLSLDELTIRCVRPVMSLIVVRVIFSSFLRWLADMAIEQ